MNRTHPHITAKIICDSVGIDHRHLGSRDDPHVGSIIAPRLTTFELTYPRYIHAELMTNRVFSRNAQSSRAIPVQRRLERVRNDPVMPIYWGANQRGMQAKEEEVRLRDECELVWRSAARFSANAAEELMEHGLHKQWANRVLETFDTITTIVTATDYENSFALRCHKDAQPEYHDLSWKMADLYFNSEPKVLNEGGWHLPLISESEFGDPICDVDAAIKASVARCARVSYLNHDGTTPDIDKDIALHDRLLADGHMSPFEHQAQVRDTDTVPKAHGNFAPGWIQYRKTLPQEVRTFTRADYERERVEQFPEGRPVYGAEA